MNLGGDRIVTVEVCKQVHFPLRSLILTNNLGGVINSRLANVCTRSHLEPLLIFSWFL